MKLSALRLHNIKRFAGEGIALEGMSEGVNVFTAANEFGKSTAFEALHALFFQPHSSTGKAVGQLRPYSGGSPVVEADIATEAGRFRLTKQFYAGKRAEVRDLVSGRVLAQADEAENFINDLTRGGSAGPAGLLWVRQGLTGIENRSKSEEETDKKVRETLLSSVQGEVEALTGGRRMAEILAACEDELGKLVTATLRPKTGGRYAQAIEERDRLAAEASRLAAEVQALHTALDQRRTQRARLAELENPDAAAARASEISAAQAAFDAAKTHSEALKVAEAEEALARNQSDAASKALEDFSRALARAEELSLRLDQANTRRDDALARRNAVVGEKDIAERAVSAAEVEELEHRQLLARLETAMRARDAAERLTALKTQLQKAEAARDQVEAGEAALAVLAITPQAVEQLAGLDLELVRLRAAQQSSLPTVRIDYAPGAAGAISSAEGKLSDGQELGFASALRLDVSGVGTLTLRSNRPADADREIEAASARYAKLRESLGVASLAEARQRLAEHQQKSADLGLARQRLADLAPSGIARLQSDIAQLTGLSIGDLELKGDIEAVRTGHAALEVRLHSVRIAQRELSPKLDAINAELVAAETALAALEAEAAGLAAQLGEPETRGPRLAELQGQSAATQAAYTAAQAKTSALRPLAQDLAGAETTLNRLKSVEAAAQSQLASLRESLADLNGAINARADSAIEETWAETKDLLATAEAAVARFQTEVAVLDRLRTSLVAARSAARDLYLKPVVTELRPLLGLLFDDIAITFDEDTLLPQSVSRNGLDEKVEHLSGGMREQLSILTRLAFARLLARGGRPAPVILDDALVYSDDDRIERMFDALHQQSREQQIIVFSCRQRAFARLGGTILQPQPWQPQR